MKQRFTLDVSGLPTHAFGPRMTMWWGTLAFCVLEGTAFVLGAGAYLYLMVVNGEWPLDADPPELLWSSLIAIGLVASVWPNMIADKDARNEDLPKVRRDLVILSAIGIGLLVLRGFEFAALDLSWDTNAYGSLVWALLGLHTAHLLTDVVDTLVLTALMFTKHAHGKRFSDVEDNAFYWNFVVLAWLFLYVLLYWVPRL
ncbi:MAG TPA: cytochrome c oxidase subunit 3 [Afifellaceae bacterium]|nr:cytochrome c oxidase subunit 3 [Afifellaceae bacterium]